MKKSRFRLAFLVLMVFALQFGYTTSDAGAANTYVSDLPFVGTPVNGWGPVEKDMSNGEQYAGDGHTISLHGVLYNKGLGVHAHSVVTYNLAGQYTSFVSDIGIDDEVGSGGSVIFQVWVDGAIIYDSGILTHESPPQHLNLDVTNKNQLQLVVNAGTTINNGHADWAGAYLVPAAGPRPLSGAGGAVANDGTIADKAGNWHISPRAQGSGIYNIVPECPDGTQACFASGAHTALCTCTSESLEFACHISMLGQSPNIFYQKVTTVHLNRTTGLWDLVDDSFQFTCGQ